MILDGVLLKENKKHEFLSAVALNFLSSKPLVETKSSEGEHNVYGFLTEVSVLISQSVHSHGNFRNKGTTLASGVCAVAITDPALWVSDGPTWHMLHKFAEHLGPLLATGGIGADVSIAGKIENGRKQA